MYELCDVLGMGPKIKHKYTCISSYFLHTQSEGELIHTLPYFSRDLSHGVRQGISCLSTLKKCQAAENLEFDIFRLGCWSCHQLVDLSARITKSQVGNAH